jgi:hypothetical protein
MQNVTNLPEPPIHQPETYHHKETVMNHTAQHSPAWVTFTYISFAASAFMVALGIWLLPLDLSMKGYLTMGFLMLTQSCITLTKTMRDMHEGDKLVNRIEDAKAERLLMEVERGQRAA